MKILKSEIKGDLGIRTQNDYPIKGIEFIDITPLIMDRKTFKKITNAFCKQIKDKEVDYIIAPEARGFLFGTAVATKLNLGLIPVRKKGKIPPTCVCKTVSFEKEYGEDFLELPILVNDDYKNKNFYIIDDIYATGNTMKAIKDAIKDLKGNVVGEGVVINIKELNNNKNLYSIIDINEEH